MTEPTTTSSSSTSTTSTPAIDLFRELCVSREVQDLSRGHVPLTVWLAAADTETAAACQAGCCHPVSGPLACHLIAACTHVGESVIHLGATDHQVVSAALTAGCLPVAVFADAGRAGVTWTRLARTHPDYDLEVTDLRVTDPADYGPSVLADLAGKAGLVVAERSCPQALAAAGRPDSSPEAQVLDLADMAGLVKPGGHLAVVTGLHRADRVVDPLPEIIARAREAGLVYLQHIIALRQPARSDRIEPRLSRQAPAAWQKSPEYAGLPTSARAHSDVLLFTKPMTPSSTSMPEPGPTEQHGEANEPATAAPAGGKL
ncbi:hypothetical protein AB0C33_37795 [Nonomuraea sp. NPDC048881]|uniref:hypothetical protein n=1 Tax=Nonomuraea sp. NPDC048881 TaxID=3155030 RepID=UPI0033EEFEF3